MGVEGMTFKIFVIFSLSLTVFCQELPKEFQKCKKSDPNFNTCLMSACDKALKTLEKGNEFFGIPAIDPFKIDSLSADHSNGNSNFNLKSSLKNANAYGLSSDVKITRIATKFDKKFQMKVEGIAKKLDIIGDYTMDGKLLILPIRGNGKVNMTLENSKVLVLIKGDFVERDGETFIDITNFKVTMEPKHAVFLFTDLFKGDRQLSNTINNFMNENWELVSNTLLPSYTEKLSDQFKEYSRKVFSKVPAKNIFME